MLAVPQPRAADKIPAHIDVDDASRASATPASASPASASRASAGLAESNSDSSQTTVILAAEQLHVDLERYVSGRIRVGKRVVSETRTVTVVVHREELVFEDVAAPAEHMSETFDAAPAPPLILVLREEVPTVAVAVRPYERVAISIEPVAGRATVRETLRREQAAASQ